MAIDIKDEFDEKAAEQLQEEMEQNEIQPDTDTVETQDGEDPIAGDTEEANEEEESKEDDIESKLGISWRTMRPSTSLPATG